MTIHYIVDAASLSVGGLSRADPKVESLRYLASQKLRRGALVHGHLREVAISLRQFVYVVGRGEVSLIQLPDEGQGSNEVGGEILGIVEEVSHSSLSIWIHQRF